MVGSLHFRNAQEFFAIPFRFSPPLPRCRESRLRSRPATPRRDIPHPKVLAASLPAVFLDRIAARQPVPSPEKLWNNLDWLRSRRSTVFFVVETEAVPNGWDSLPKSAAARAGPSDYFVNCSPPHAPRQRIPFPLLPRPTNPVPKKSVAARTRA